jgi:hypothetical protein
MTRNPAQVLALGLLMSAVLAVPAGAAENACRYSTQAEASAVLGKPSRPGEPEGDTRCFFAAADTKGAPAREYADLGVDRHDSVKDAEFRFLTTERLPGTVRITGLGDRAQFRTEDGAGILLVRSGTRTVLVSVTSQSQKDQQAALRAFAAAILSRL